MAKLHFYYSAMNAGKSTTLLQSSYNYQERGMDTILYTPDVASSFGLGKITTRIGLQSHAIAIPKEFAIYADVGQRVNSNPNIRCVLIDEAQFLTKEQVCQLACVTDDFDIPVLAYGLRTDFRGEPFEGSLYLLSWSDQLIELKTICHCGSKATMNIRVDQKGQKVTQGQQVEIGGKDRYVAVCRKHFRLGQTQRMTEEPAHIV